MKNNTKQLKSSSRIPEELHYEILLRLSVKSVLDCKSVCKSWYSMISSPSFAKFHLKQNKNNSSSSRLLLEFDGDIQSICYDLLESSLSSEEIEDSTVRLRCPFKLGIVTLFGACNGLVFLCSTDHFCPTDYGKDYNYCIGADDFLCVWNPDTEDYIKINQPHPEFHRFLCILGLGYLCIYGLEYDGKNDDYKFVIGTRFDCWKTMKRGPGTEVYVYSLKSNLWVTIETPYIFTCEEKSGVLVNGDLHWLAKGKCGVCIVYLDCSSSLPSFKEIQLPKVPDLKFISVGVLEEGSLCILAHNGDVGLGHVEVWEMKVYGLPETWTKRYVIANETISKAFEYYRKIIWSCQNGKIVFVDLCDVVLYDPKHGSTVERDLYRLAGFTSAVNYLPSLVSPTDQDKNKWKELGMCYNL